MVAYVTQLPWRLGNTVFDNRLRSRSKFTDNGNSLYVDGRTFPCPSIFPKYKIAILTSNGIHELICTATSHFSTTQIRDSNLSNTELVPIYLKLDQNPNSSIPYSATVNTSPSVLTFVDNIMVICKYLWNGPSLNCLTIADLLNLDITPDALTDLNTNYPIGSAEVIFPEILHRFFEICRVMQQWRVSPINDLTKDLASSICSFSNKDLALDFIWGCIDEGIIDQVHNNVQWECGGDSNNFAHSFIEELTTEEFFSVIADTLGNVPNDAFIKFVIHSGGISLGKIRPFLDPELDSNNQLFNDIMKCSELTIQQWGVNSIDQAQIPGMLVRIPSIAELIHQVLILPWNNIDVTYTIDELYFPQAVCSSSYGTNNVWQFVYNNMMDLSQNVEFEREHNAIKQKLIITLQHVVSEWVAASNRNVFKVRVIKTYSEEFLLMIFHNDSPDNPHVMYFDLVLEVMGSHSIPNTPVFWNTQSSKIGNIQ